MPLTDYQRKICRLIANHRIAQGESYVAGGAALNTLLPATRVSRDIDLFHDTREAVRATWDADRSLLEREGLMLEVIRERDTFVEAIVREKHDSVVLQWAQDSAFRFFPLVQHEDFGLTLHPFDLATNKVLAMVGRVEVRDWIDVITCSKELQPLGYLAWAACGKDPGFSPKMILAEARRTCRYSAGEVAALHFQGTAPDVAKLSAQWHTIADEADSLVNCLPPVHAGTCVLTAEGDLFTKSVPELQNAVANRQLLFHAGSIRGAVPELRPDE